jgi:hypothetical protein
MRLILIKLSHAAGWYIAMTVWRRNHVMDQYNAAVALNEYLIRTAVEFWTALAFPAIYYAKNL